MAERIMLRPGEIARFVVQHFEDLLEQQIVEFEHQLAAGLPRSDELGLLYALRVSKCVPTAKSFSTLNSRWNVAAGNQPSGRCTGLIVGCTSPDYEFVRAFLGSLYRRRFHELVIPIVGKTEKAAIRAKTEIDRGNVFFDAASKLHETGKTMLIDGMYEFLNSLCSYFKRRAQGDAIDLPEPPPLVW